MPTLLLSARPTDDAQKIWRACIAEKREVIRAHNWRVPGISVFSVISCSIIPLSLP